jgi:IPT/TIG domain
VTAGEPLGGSAAKAPPLADRGWALRPAAWVVCLLSAAGGCASGRDIVEDSFFIAEAYAAPEVTGIVDVGGGDVPLAGEVGMEPSDGVAVIGETLWIHGRSFGRQPTVMVGGRPAAVLGRTHDGSIVARVPVGTPSGAQEVVVSNEIGRGKAPITVRRYAAILAPSSGRLAWAELGAGGASAAGVMPLAGGRWVALSSDGRAAYVAEAQGGMIDVIELPAPGAPRLVYRLDLGPGTVRALAVAGRAPVLAVVRDTDVVLVDTSSPLHPARSAPRALPQEVRDGHVTAVDVSPDGQRLAIATELGNRVMLLDLVPAGRARLLGTIAVAPQIREGVLVDVAFAPAGDTLWILSGDTPRSLPAGPQPTELRAVRLGSDPRSFAHLDMARVVGIDQAGAPARLCVGRALPLASGAAIRPPPERNTVFFAAAARATGGTAVFRVGAEDTATVAIASPARLGRPDVSPDGRWLLAPAAAADGAVAVLTAAIDGRPVAAGAALPFDAIDAAPGAAPARPAPELRVQP